MTVTPGNRLGCLLAVTALSFLGGCDSFIKAPSPPAATIATPTLPGKSPPLRVSQFVFYSDVPLKADAPLFQELTDLRDQLHRDLHLPPSNTVVQVFLFDKQEPYELFMRFRYPDLPPRRAFFIGQPRSAGGPDDLLVYTYWGDYIRQDLRHELTHALLHSVLKEVPLWLDEGLAEYYELPPEKRGLNATHLAALRTNGLTPDLAALEKLDQVSQMGRVQYQESWAWVHLMMNSNPQTRDALLGYLQALRGPSPAGNLLPRLREVLPSPETTLTSHLTQWDAPAATLRPASTAR